MGHEAGIQEGICSGSIGQVARCALQSMEWTKACVNLAVVLPVIVPWKPGESAFRRIILPRALLRQ
jgi:hypothetical protein